jgi:hypothetical protein
VASAGELGGGAASDPDDAGGGDELEALPEALGAGVADPAGGAAGAPLADGDAVAPKETPPLC